MPQVYLLDLSNMQPMSLQQLDGVHIGSVSGMTQQQVDDINSGKTAPDFTCENGKCTEGTGSTSKKGNGAAQICATVTTAALAYFVASF